MVEISIGLQDHRRKLLIDIRSNPLAEKAMPYLKIPSYVWVPRRAVLGGNDDPEQRE